MYYVIVFVCSIVWLLSSVLCFILIEEVPEIMPSREYGFLEQCMSSDMNLFVHTRDLRSKTLMMVASGGAEAGAADESYQQKFLSALLPSMSLTKKRRAEEEAPFLDVDEIFGSDRDAVLPRIPNGDGFRTPPRRSSAVSESTSPEASDDAVADAVASNKWGQ